MQQNNPASPAKVKVAERRRKALALRKQGGSYRQIADQLRKLEGISPKYSVGLAYRDVMDELKKLNAECAEEAEAIRRLELERLDELFAHYYPKAVKGDYASLDRILAIMGQRARYLDLYAAAKIAGPDGGPIQAQVTAHVTTEGEAQSDDAADNIAAILAILAEAGVLPSGAGQAGDAQADQVHPAPPDPAPGGVPVA